MTVYILLGMAIRDSRDFIAPQTPNPHEVPLESLHRFQNSSNHSDFLSGVQFI
jgi:hypothetical protein